MRGGVGEEGPRDGSGRSSRSYHAHYINEQSNLIELAQPALLGLPSPAFDTGPVGCQLLKARPCRHPLLSAGSTGALLQSVGDAGSYMLRLKYTVAQLDRLSSSSLHVALAAELHRQLSVPPPKPGPPLRFAIEVKQYTQHLYMLCRVIGCHNLEYSLLLEELPSAVTLLDRVYKVALAQFQPGLKALLWRLLRCVVDPWLEQLDNMLGHALAPSLVWDHPEVYIGDMFAKRERMRFVLDNALVPKFMPLDVAQLAVEALNCRLVLGPKDIKAQRITTHQMPQTDVWRDKTFKVYTAPVPAAAPAQNAGAPHTAPSDISYEVSQMLRHVYSMHAELNRHACSLLEPLLAQHVRIIKQLFLLQDGNLWLQLDELFKHTQQLQPTEQQIAQLNRHVLAFYDARLVLGGGLYYGLQVEYTPPRELASIVTAGLIHSLQRAFARLLQLQRQYREDRDPAPLSRLTSRLNLEASGLGLCAGSVEKTVLQFASFNEVLCSLLELS